jgi:hypothetical protein
MTIRQMLCLSLLLSCTLAVSGRAQLFADDEVDQVTSPAPAGRVIGEWVVYEKTAKKRAAPATRAWWNNNPGNLYKAADYPGKIGNDGTFAIFESYEVGLEAVRLKVLYHTRQGLTLGQLGDIWCKGCDYGKKLADLLNEDQERTTRVTVTTKLADLGAEEVRDAIRRAEGSIEGIELDRHDPSLPPGVRIP